MTGIDFDTKELEGLLERIITFTTETLQKAETSVSMAGAVDILLEGQALNFALAGKLAEGLVFLATQIE